MGGWEGAGSSGQQLRRWWGGSPGCAWWGWAIERTLCLLWEGSGHKGTIDFVPWLPGQTEPFTGWLHCPTRSTCLQGMESSAPGITGASPWNEGVWFLLFSGLKSAPAWEGSRGSPDTVQCVMLMMVGSLAGPSALFSFPNLGVMAVCKRIHAQRSLYTPRAEVSSPPVWNVSGWSWHWVGKSFKLEGGRRDLSSLSTQVFPWGIKISNFHVSRFSV